MMILDMDAKYVFRNFTNGSALGVDIRSHMKNFYVPNQQGEHTNAPEKNDDLGSLESYSSISSQYVSRRDEEKGLDREFSSVLIEDVESDTDSPKDHSICRKSKRVLRDPRTSEFARFGTRSTFSGLIKKSKFGDEANKCSAATPEEDVAYCLMMLSRDKWVRDEKESNLCGEKYESGDHFSGDSDVSKVRKNRFRGRYKCETCNKLFRSYQALGGHMASDKKIRHSPFHESSSEMADSGGGSAAVAEEEKQHECPFCDRVFSSGQALGGHKRSHFARGGGISRNINNNVRPVGSSTPVESISKSRETLKIDLNLPAPVPGDEDEMSQIAVSAVLDA